MQNWRIPGMNTLARMTPLTGHYLSRTDPNQKVSPISTAIESVNKLQLMLNGREAKPSVVLSKIFEACPNNPREAIEKRIGKLGDQFISCYTQQTKEIPGSHIEFAKKRLQLGTTLFYMLLEVTTIDEQQKKGNTGIPVNLIFV
jgi:Retinoblastoma-associated protein A domain